MIVTNPGLLRWVGEETPGEWVLYYLGVTELLENRIGSVSRSLMPMHRSRWQDPLEPPRRGGQGSRHDRQVRGAAAAAARAPSGARRSAELSSAIQTKTPLSRAAFF